MKRQLSIIITYHNEGVDFVCECINQIKETIKDIDEYEIIVVDDYSTVPLELHYDNCKVIRHTENLGVGAGFDTGVKAAKYENLFIHASDIRFIDNGWAGKMYDEIDKYPKAFTASMCIGLNQYSRCCNEDIVNGKCSKCEKDAVDNMDIEYRRTRMKSNGATILMFHDKSTNPSVAESFRGVIEAKWFPAYKGTGSFEVPCILGAFYGVKKSWYNYVDGWTGHKLWGTLEPLISLKSWLFGGSCRVASDVETGHIFKKHGSHGTPLSTVLYNKYWTASVLLEDSKRVIDFLGNNKTLEGARALFAENKSLAEEKRKEYFAKKVMHEQDFFNMWDIDYRTVHSKVTPDLIRDECNHIYGKEDEKRHYNRPYSSSPYLRVWTEVAKHVNAGDSVVDIGCGVGQVMNLMLDKKVDKYAGFDISAAAISNACKRLVKRTDQDKVSLTCANIFDWDVIPDADVYIMIEILEHITLDKQMLAKIPAGKRIVITLPSFLGGSHVRKFDSCDEVAERYSDIIVNSQVVEVKHGQAKIFVMSGMTKAIQ